MSTQRRPARSRSRIRHRTSPIDWDFLNKRKPSSRSTKYYIGDIKRNSTPALFQRGGASRVVSTQSVSAVYGRYIHNTSFCSFPYLPNTHSTCNQACNLPTDPATSLTCWKLVLLHSSYKRVSTKTPKHSHYWWKSRSSTYILCIACINVP